VLKQLKQLKVKLPAVFSTSRCWDQGQVLGWEQRQLLGRDERKVLVLVYLRGVQCYSSKQRVIDRVIFFTKSKHKSYRELTKVIFGDIEVDETVDVDNTVELDTVCCDLTEEIKGFLSLVGE